MGPENEKDKESCKTPCWVTEKKHPPSFPFTDCGWTGHQNRMVEAGSTRCWRTVWGTRFCPPAPLVTFEHVEGNWSSEATIQQLKIWRLKRPGWFPTLLKSTNSWAWSMPTWMPEFVTTGTPNIFWRTKSEVSSWTSKTTVPISEHWNEICPPLIPSKLLNWLALVQPADIWVESIESERNIENWSKGSPPATCTLWPWKLSLQLVP